MPPNETTTTESAKEINSLQTLKRQCSSRHLQDDSPNPEDSDPTEYHHKQQTTRPSATPSQSCIVNPTQPIQLNNKALGDANSGENTTQAPRERRACGSSGDVPMSTKSQGVARITTSKPWLANTRSYIQHAATVMMVHLGGLTISSNLDVWRTTRGTSEGSNATTAPQYNNFDSDPFRGPLPIPHVSPPTYAYPNSASKIPEAYHARFSQIVSMFRQNTQEDPQLSDCVKHVDYDLKLCGPSRGMARPSILVFCREKEFKPLWVLLNRRHLKAQYYPQLNQRFGLGPSKPFFRLYFWRTQRPRVLLGTDVVQVRIGDGGMAVGTDAANEPMLSLCGCPIYKLPKDQRVSKLGCIIQMGEDFYGLTASHGLRRKALWSETNHKAGEDSKLEARDQLEYIEGENISLNLGSKDTLKFDDDVIYEVFSDVDSYECIDEDNSYDCQDRQAGLTRAHVKVKGTQQSDTATIAIYPQIPRGIADNLEMDLDWALVQLEQPSQHRPNAFCSSDDPPRARFMSTIAAEFPDNAADVLIVVSPSVTKRGVLQPGKAFLGGINGDQFSEVGCVILNDNQKLYHGDSGSVVVDAHTFNVYGHVVGLNPLGEIYVSPLIKTLRQIQETFSNDKVLLPDPVLLLIKSINYYLDSEDYSAALTRIKYLLELPTPTARDAFLNRLSRDIIWSFGDMLQALRELEKDGHYLNTDKLRVIEELRKLFRYPRYLDTIGLMVLIRLVEVIELIITICYGMVMLLVVFCWFAWYSVVGFQFRRG